MKNVECSIPGCDAVDRPPACTDPEPHFAHGSCPGRNPGTFVPGVPTRARAQGRRTPVSEDAPRAFMLVRYTDVSGVSGEGVVAYGVQWRSGKVSLEWCVPGLPSSVATWDCIADVLVIHGHGNNTVVKWLDDVVELRNAAGEVCVRE